MSWYNISIYKISSQKIFVSADMAPDISYGLVPVQVISQFFSETSNIDPHTSRIRTQMQFITPLSCDLKPEIPNPTYRRVVV